MNMCQKYHADNARLTSCYTFEFGRDLMAAEMTKPYWTKLKTFLAAQNNKTTFPPPEFIFNALQSCPPERVKVVVLGQA